jgi:hypothetical protein
MFILFICLQEWAGVVAARTKKGNNEFSTLKHQKMLENHDEFDFWLF